MSDTLFSRKKPLLIKAGIALLSITLLYAAYSIFFSPTKIALINFPSYQVSNIRLSNDSYFLEVDEVAPEQASKLKGYDAILVFGPGLRLTEGQVKNITEAGTKGTMVYTYVFSSDIIKNTNIDSIQIAQLDTYYANRCKDNFKNMLHFIRKEFDRKKVIANRSEAPIIIPSDFLYHLDNKKYYNTADELTNYLKEKKIYKEGAPRIAFISGMTSPLEGNRSYIDSIICGFENAGYNIYPISGAAKRIPLIKEIDPDAIIYLPMGRLGNDSFVEWLTEKNIPLFCPYPVMQSHEEWITIVGKAKKMPGGGTIVNTASVDPTNSGITDTDLTNNQATVTTSILNPNVDLKIEKGVSNNGIAQLSGNTYTITVSNVSTNSKPDSKVVSVTDIIPEGLTVTGYTAEGWSLSQTGNSYTFSRSNELASMYAYPPITINVKPSGSGPWINTATVNYAEDTNLANNSSSVKLSWLNYWQGTIDTDWAKQGNWTANAVPLTGENIEFATEINNGASGKGNGTGAAIKDLYLDKDRTIGDLINDSNVDLVVTTENQLTINGSVKDNNPNKGTIRVKTSPDKATGTLLFTNPGNNTAVNATVEFYNKAYECETCGFYRKQWQYFGIPVNASSFPYTGVETVNQWVEPYNGNKWRPAPYAPDVALQAFKGYEITNSSTTLPDKIYNFSGLLNVDDAIVTTSKTAAVNYSGMNLIGNSYTAAIPISKDAIAFESDLLTEETVYLFNTGTRDQWRKLNGSIAYGVNGGQYQAVPIEVANQEGLPDRILSMHTFMLNTKKNGSIGIEYSKLVKNQLINQQAWRSAKSSNAPLPYIIMDVISNSSADRVWLFENATASYGFDNGWDGYKISETDIIQAYVTDLENEKYQIATVPQLTGSTLGLEAGKGEGYTLNLSVAPEVESRNLYLQDLQTGKNFAIKNNSEYYVEGSSLPKKRFKIVEGISSTPDTEYISSLINIYVKDNTVTVNNQSDMDCTAFIYDLRGILIVQKKISAYQTEYFNNIPLLGKGVYIVKVKSDKHSLNEVSRVMVQ